MAAGINEGDKGRHLMTYHPLGWTSSSRYFHNDEWLDFNMLQSGHARKNFDNYRMIEEDYALVPSKPCMDGEPCYEGHPVDWNPDNGFFDDQDARQAAYWALLAGAHGHTYGCQHIWQVYTPGKESDKNWLIFWREALNLPGAWGMLYMRNLFESRPFYLLVPDQSIIKGGAGEGEDHIRAARASDGSFAFIYIPTGKPVQVDGSKLSGSSIRAWWYNPREGSAALIGIYSRKNELKFNPPSSGRGCDWVLVLDDASKNYSMPGR